MPAKILSYQRPWLAKYQLDALFNAERYAVVEATTKAGKTVGCMVWIAEQAITKGDVGRHFWWVAPIREQAKMVFERMKRALPREALGASVPTANPTARAAYKGTNESELRVILANGASIWFKGADKPDSLYGEDVYAAVIDEATRCKEAAWHAVRSTLTATRGPIRIIGNVKGRRNWAYTLARKAEAGAPGMSYAKITAVDAVKAGILKSEEIENARSVLPEAVFRELYMAEPSDDSGNPFGAEAIRACVGPKSYEQPVCYGLDLAKSVDWSVLIGLDAAGAVCHYERWQEPWEYTIQHVLDSVEQVPVLVDSTGVGDPILEQLQKQGRDKGLKFMGYPFTSASKQKLMEGLAVAIQRKLITFPAEGQIVPELESFEYIYGRTGVKYSAPEGLHDDCVCALALAVNQFATISPSILLSDSAILTRDEPVVRFGYDPTQDGFADEDNTEDDRSWLLKRPKFGSDPR